jgi:hypothetical protein
VIKLAAGNWAQDPASFMGAIVASYEIMLEHTVRLLVTCFGILLQDVAVSLARSSSILSLVLISTVSGSGEAGATAR